MNSANKFAFKILDRVAPSLTANKIYNVMTHPRSRRLKELEEKILDSAYTRTIKFQGFDIATYTWGNYNEDIAFLVHGWEGHAANFGSIISVLVEAGYKVIAFDAPSHGRSSKGKTDMNQFSELVSILLKEHRPKLIVSHSFGSVTTVRAMAENQDIPIDLWIAVTTPHDFKNYIGQIQQKIGASEQTMTKVISRVESDFGTSLDNMNMQYFSNRIGHVQDVVIIHSKNDKILPIDSARITSGHIEQSRLIELEGYGHNSILWSKELKEILRSELVETTMSLEFN